MRCRIPIVYLVDSAGVNLPYQGGVFPGQYGAARIFYYNSIMRRYLRDAAARRGDGAVHRRRRVPAGAVRRDRDGEGHVVHGPRRPEPREGRDRPDDRRRDARRRGHAHARSAASRTTRWTTTTRASRSCASSSTRLPRARDVATTREPPRRRRRPSALYDLLPADHRMSYDMHDVLRAILDDGALDEFQANLAKEMICGDARIDGIPVGVIANQRGLIKGRAGREAALRRHRLRGERREGRVLHRSLRPPGHPAAVRAGRLRLHGRPRGRARGHHPRRRAVRRGDGHGARAEDRAHGQPRLAAPATTRWRARASIPTSSSRWPTGPHGGDGRRERRCRRCTVRRIDEGAQGRRARRSTRRRSSRSTRCAPTTSTSSTRATPPRAASSTPSSIPRRRATCSRIALRASLAESRAAPRRLRPSARAL